MEGRKNGFRRADEKKMRPVWRSRPRRGPRVWTSSDPSRRIFRVLPVARPSATISKMVSTIRPASLPVTPPWTLRTAAARSAFFNVEPVPSFDYRGGGLGELYGSAGVGVRADLWSAQAAAGGRQTRTPAEMVGLRPGQSDAQARERRPLVGTGRRRRPADKDPDCGDGSPLNRDPSLQRHPDGCVVHPSRPAPRSGADRRSAVPALRAALPTGVPDGASLSPTPPCTATRRQGNADLWSAQAAAGGRQTRTPTAEMVLLSTGTPALSVIRTAAWYTPRPAPPAPALYRERFFLYSRVRRTGVPAKP